MNCPHCAIPLTVSDRQGIEIDHCGQCRGVWLDRGELDKIIERTMGSWGGGSGGRQNSGSDDRDYGSRQNQNHNHRRDQERENPLLEIFDLFGG